VRGTALVVALLGLVPVVARMASDKGEQVEVASETVDGLLGRTFVSVSATEGGEPYPLAAGTRLVLTFKLDRWFQADAGCNEFGGRLARESEQTLVVEQGEMHSTMMDCPERRAQEEWFSRLLGDEPTVVLGGGRLVLTAGDRRVEFVEGDVDAARHLIGRTWTVEWVIVDPSKSPVTPVHPATMVFTESAFRISSHCEEGLGTIEWSRGTVRVGGWRREGFPCDGQQNEPDVVAALETGLFLLEVSESHATLRNASGRGVVLRGP
jgi:heat shock protein HslJ